MSRSLVLVSEPEFIRAERLFTSFAPLECVPGPVGDEELASQIRTLGARHVILGPMAYPRAIYDVLPKGSVVARFGVGYDGINVARATAAGLLCTNTPGVLHQSVAELTLFLMGAAARHLLPTANAMREGRWSPSSGAELAGSTLAVIGTGTIGRAVARMAAAGFGMRVIGCTRRSAEADDVFAEMTADFEQAVRSADFVSLHIPGIPENRHFINTRRLAAMRPDAWLINTARGAVVDERALFDALASGTIAGAALDVFDREPYVPLEPAYDFRTLGNVILLPHVGSNTAAANRRMGERALANIIRAEAEEFDAMDLLNPDVVARR
jgi:phosphoglycerate dehydrogenase-like enzyme